jgi:hypothetical protein
MDLKITITCICATLSVVFGIWVSLRGIEEMQRDRHRPYCKVRMRTVDVSGYRAPRWKCPNCGIVKRRKTIC